MMRTYRQAVSYIANNAVTDWMNGGTGQIGEVSMVAFIFGKTNIKVVDDVYKKVAEIQDETYKVFQQSQKE
jgi:hypothetical protein